MVEIKHSSFIALLDSGSTHNFIADNVVAATGIFVRPYLRLGITVANGDRLTSLGLCRAMALRIGQEAFTLDCYAMPLEGFDVILGV